MACRSDQDAKWASVLFSVQQIFFRSLLWLPLGLALLILYPVTGEPVGTGAVSEQFRLEREGTFVAGIRDFLPAGLRGLMLTGMLAALASTVDTHLNWGASYWTNDIYKRWVMEQFLKRRPKGSELVWVARFSTVEILAIALLIMSRLNLIQSAWHLSLLFGSGLGVVLMLRWLWHRINLWSEISAGVISLIAGPVLVFGFPDLEEGLKLIIMTAVSTAGMIAVTLLTKAEPREKLIAFYKRVRPPGFWKPIAQAAGADPNAPLQFLKQGLAATVCASCSIAFLLVGFGTLLVSGMPLESRAPFYWIAAGLLLIPIWVKLSGRMTHETL
jgi:Na+/proline symporter